METERQVTVIGRILATLSRNQAFVLVMNVNATGRNTFNIEISIDVAEQKVDFLSKRLHKEIDIISLKVIQAEDVAKNVLCNDHSID